MPRQCARRGIAFFLVLLCGSCAASGAVGPDGLISFGPRKGAGPEFTDRSHVKLYCKSLLPVRGVVVGSGSFLVRSAAFVMVDLDRHTLRQVVIDRDAGAPAPTIRYDNTLSLDQATLNDVITLTNPVWRSGIGNSKQKVVLDAVESLILLDGDRVFQDDHAQDYQAGDAVYEKIWALTKQLPKLANTPEPVSCNGP